MRGYSWKRSLPMVCAALLAAGCDDSFSPKAPTELQYSIFGYLDAAADTQWIRLTPIRDLVPTTAEPLDVTVRLEHLGRGETVTLRDSIFRYTQAQYPELGSEGLFLHNFWTTSPIEPGASYRLAVSRPGKVPVEAEVRTPGAYVVEVWLNQSRPGNDVVRLEGLEHVAFVAATTHYYNRCGTFSRRDSFRPPGAPGDTQMVSVKKVQVLSGGDCGGPITFGRDLWLVGSGAPWPAKGSIAPGNPGAPEAGSNVPHSVGFLGGVLTRTVPYEECTLAAPGPAAEYCRLRYDGRTAALAGAVVEVRCGDGPIDSMVVAAEEIDLVPGRRRHRRNALTSRTGEYRIAALEPGIRHVVSFRSRRVRDEMGFLVPTHSEYVDTLIFAPGEQRRLDLGLERWRPVLCESM